MRRRWAPLAVLALAIAAVALAYLAFRDTDASKPPSTAPTSTPTASPSDTGTPPPDVQPPLSLIDATVAFRAIPGGCTGTSTLERTTDGGHSWSSWPFPASDIQSVVALDAQSVEVIGADKKCRVGLYSTTSAGHKWKVQNPTGAEWYRDPSNTRQMVTPSGVVANPCDPQNRDVISIADLNDLSAFVLCANGAIEASNDSGASWQTASNVHGAVAFTWVDANNGWLISIGVPGCPGLQLSTSTDAGHTWATGACVGGRDLLVPGPRPSMAFADLTHGLLIVADKTFTTADGGASWQPA